MRGNSHWMKSLHYLAYGSNLHPLRLMERVPSARLIGVTEITGYQLRFHKRGKDGSAKCDLCWSDDRKSSVFGAIYRIASNEKPILDRAEGRGSGYLDTGITVQHGHIEFHCFTYLAQQSHIANGLKPFHWYKELVALGAKHLDFPHAYIECIQSVDSAQDHDNERRQYNEALLRRVRLFIG